MDRSTHFCTCVFVYLANGETISSTDNVSSSVLAFNWLDNHSLNFDIFRDGYLYRTDTKHGANGIPHFFVEAANSHLSSTYPIGNVILTFPLYFLFFVGIKAAEFYQNFILGNSVDFLRLSDPSFEGALQHYQKLAAVGVASFSTVIFYLANRLKFNGAIAILSTFIFAFATSTWMTGSQGLWQHGSSNLAVLCIIFCLLKANRTQGKNRKILLVLTGVFCGLLPGIRSTSLLYSVAAIAYAFFIYRKEALYLLLGLPSALISASWNIYYFGFSLSKLVVGGYSRFSDQEASFTSSYYNLTIEQFLTGFGGLLISPSRGILVFTPVSLLAIPGAWQVWKWRAGKDEKLFLCLTVAAIGIFLQYCFFKVWTGGACYGPRYLTDILPIVCFLISYCLAGWVERWNQGKHKFSGIKLAILTLLIAISTFTQTVGAFGSTNWDGIPQPTPERIWQLHDNQIERHTKHVFYKAFDPIGDRDQYLQGWNGVIESVRKQNGKPLKDLIEVTPSRKMILTAQVKNTGQVPWMGYETGLARGRTQVGVKFIDSQNQTVRIKAGQGSRLYIAGTSQPGATALAIGRVNFPQKLGDYKLVLELDIGGAKKATGILKPTYTVNARVVPEP
ncbi:MAG: hypothetical protein HC781_03680 [Leptolyngbyaceae cyanobacterium CSU_1_4]|nr:hypothetical protein [Leptolyngbyaceae cyanobacterium CSU_1_4]